MKIKNLLEGIVNGEIVLPEFQRSFIWEPEDLRELLVSIVSGYFIGSMLILETTKDDCPFYLRLIEGVEKLNPKVEIKNLIKVILDGQQRATSIFYAMYEPNLALKGRKSAYIFYVNLNEAFSNNWDDAIIAISKNDKKNLTNYEEKEKSKEVIKFSKLKEVEEWIDEIEDKEKRKKVREISNNINNYEINIIPINKKEPDFIVETFERINKTGEPLSVFDLMTAKLYRSGVKLRDLYNFSYEKYDFIKYIDPIAILKVVSLLRNKDPRRSNLFKLEADNFENNWSEACELLEKAFKRLTDIKMVMVL